MHRRILLALSSCTMLALALAPACGGATDPHDLLGGGTGGGTQVDAGGDTSILVGSPDSGDMLDTGTSSDTGTGEIDSGGGLPEASPVPDSGGGGHSFSCPPGTCKAPEVCCATGTGQGNTPTFTCQGATKACGDATGPGTPISCASAADCPGKVCCGDNLNGFYSRVSCATSCSGPGTGGGTLITFCDPAGNDCPPATPTCQPSQVLAGFNVCN